jgi:uncharacterized protein DUF4266
MTGSNLRSRASGRARAFACVAVVACIASGLASCASFDPPKPWEKGDLARPSMRFDADPLAAKATQHIYQSKEGAAGGGAVGGGGCGCN